MKPFLARSQYRVKNSNTLVYCLWLGGIIGSFIVLRPGWDNPPNRRDFAFFWVAGKLAATGKAADAYYYATYKAAAATLASTSVTIEFPYPPHFLLLAAPLSMLPLNVAFVAWLLISATLFYIAARPYIPRGVPAVAALLTPSAILSMAFGQTGLLFGALWLWCFSGSTLAAALLSIKPHLAIAAGFELLRTRVLVRTIAIGSLICGISALAFGVGAWRAYLEGAATNHFNIVGNERFVVWYLQMTTPYLGYGLVGWLAFAAAAVFLLVRRITVFTAATATFLISPYGFQYDMTVVSLGFGVLLLRSWHSMRRWQIAVCALAFLSPVLVRAGTWLVPPVLLLGLLVQVDLETDDEGSPQIRQEGAA